MESVFVLSFKDECGGTGETADGVMRVYRDANRAAQDLELLNTLPCEAFKFSLDEVPIFDGAPAPRETKDPVEWMKKQRAAAEKPVQERCLEALREDLIDTHDPFSFDDVLMCFHHLKFQERTVRKALGKLVDAGELQMTSDGLYRKPAPPESRAVTTQSSPAESPPVGADGGAGDEDFPIMRRVPRQDIAAAE